MILIQNKTRQIIIGIAVAEILIAGLIMVLLLRGGNESLILVLALDVGLVVDALIMSSNANEGASRIRFVAHGLLTPLLIPISAYAVGLSGTWIIVTWVVTIIIMILGVWQGLTENLTTVTYGNVSRYTQAPDNKTLFKIISGILSFGMLLPLIAAGIAVIVLQGNVLLIIAAACMFLFSAIGPAIGHKDLIFLLSMFGEVLMVLFIALYYV